MQFVLCAIGSLKWRSARVFWKGAKGPALPRNFGDCYWECLSHSVLIAQLKNLEQNSYEHLKMYFTDFHQLIGQLVRSQGVWRRICERVQVTTGQASHTSDVLAPACAGAHVLTYMSCGTVRGSDSQPCMSEWDGLGARELIPLFQRGDSQVILPPAKGCFSSRIPSSSTPFLL